jgi:hypothetical protein
MISKVTWGFTESRRTIVVFIFSWPAWQAYVIHSSTIFLLSLTNSQNAVSPRLFKLSPKAPLLQFTLSAITMLKLLRSSS